MLSKHIKKQTALHGLELTRFQTKRCCYNSDYQADLYAMSSNCGKKCLKGLETRLYPLQSISMETQGITLNSVSRTVAESTYSKLSCS